MEDFDALQGLWFVESIMYRGQASGHGFTHYEFEGGKVKQIVPYHVNGGTWGTFKLEPTTTPKRIDTTYEHEGKNGEGLSMTHKECYELTGDTLRIGGSQVIYL